MNRAKVLTNARRIVVKVGSRVITSSKNELDLKLVESLVKDIKDLHKKNYQVLIVTSGAIVAGLKSLKIPSRPTDLPLKQAASAVGQVELMHSYSTAFKKHNIPTAQILLTRDDLHNRHRYLNARNTMLRLLEKGVIPIINENDTVAVDEIKFGDNDTLAALVALMMDADILTILTDISGLYTDMPRKNKDAELISHVDKVTAKIEKMAKCKGAGAGGMETKIQAAKMLTTSGIPVVIANGREKNILTRLITCEALGTFFAPAKQRTKSKKRWLAFLLKTKGEIIIDKGAKEALLKKGKSLLPSGILSVKGRFDSGESVSITDEKNKELARGLSNYNSEEIEKIKGLRTSEIKKALGYKDYDEVIHRDNLVVL